ncbi:MAG: adenosylcobinamide-phosphate synthase CbiB [Burkholderiaceae bacterium]
MPDLAVLAGSVLVALGLDVAIGEPPARLHPVVAMGRYLGAAGRCVSRQAGAGARPAVEFLAGSVAWCLGALLVVTVAVVLVMAMQGWPPLWQLALLGLVLKPMLSWRMLRDEVRAVEAALAESLPAGRARVGRLVSRDVASLNEARVREAAVSTLAENLNDSVVAPLFWFAVAGLPGAALYRFANTADAMWGYRGERGGRDWTWAGKWAARADDVLSWLPARLTALLIAAPSRWRNWGAVVANAALTPSPNGGWPMGALAEELGVRLGKPGVYELNRHGRVPASADTGQALRRCGSVVAMLAGVATVALAAGVVR